MSLYNKLVRSNLIEFDRLLLDKYQLLDIDEVDCVLLIKIDKFMKIDGYLDYKRVSSDTTLTKANVSKRIVSLAERGYIELDINNDGKDTITFNGIISRINDLLEDEVKTEKQGQKNNEVKEIVEYISKSFGKVLSPNDLETINHWINIDKFSKDECISATDDCLFNKRLQVKYIDSVLNNKKSSNEKLKESNIQEKFNNVFNKIK